MMDYKNWNEKINNNFNNAAHSYFDNSLIQKYFAHKLTDLIKNLDPPIGEWYDLGSGTGYLADLIESQLISPKVTRVDFCSKMLLEHKKDSKTILWDLNLDLPNYINNSSIIISSFCLHWLNEPEVVIQQWFDRLVHGGFLIILIPTNKSFSEWKETCKKCDIEYSGLTFPNPDILKSFFKKNEIFSITKYIYKETFPNIYKLFKSMINTGSQSTLSDRKTISELKLMQKKWPKDKYENVNLTWEINVLILRK